MKRIILLFGFCLVFFIGCKKEQNCPTISLTPPPPESTIDVHLVPMLNEAPYTMKDIIISENGYRYYFTRVQLISTNTKKGNGDLYRPDFLYDSQNYGTRMFTGLGTVADFGSISFDIGVGNNMNNSDPTLPDSSSALNILNANDMHWGWNPGYIFLKLEGRADFSDDGIDNFDDLIAFHLGASGLLRNVELNNLKWTNVNNTSNRLDLKLNMKNIFDEPEIEHDLKTYPTSHSESSKTVLSNKIMDQFVKAIYQ